MKLRHLNAIEKAELKDINDLIYSSKFDLALEKLKQMILKKPNCYTLQVNIASLYYKLKEFDKSIYYFKESIKLIEHSPFSYYNLALIYKIKKDYFNALFNIDCALVFDYHPLYLNFIYLKGEILIQKGEPMLALEFVEKLRIEGKIEEGDLYFSFLGNCYYASGKIEKDKNLKVNFLYISRNNFEKAFAINNLKANYLQNVKICEKMINDLKGKID